MQKREFQTLYLLIVKTKVVGRVLGSNFLLISSLMPNHGMSYETCLFMSCLKILCRTGDTAPLSPWVDWISR